MACGCHCQGQDPCMPPTFIKRSAIEYNGLQGMVRSSYLKTFRTYCAKSDHMISTPSGEDGSPILAQ